MRSACRTGFVDAAPAGARGLPVGGSALLVAMACGSDVDERGRGGGNRDAGEIERCRDNEAHLVGGAGANSLHSSPVRGVVMRPFPVMTPSCTARWMPRRAPSI